MVWSGRGRRLCELSLGLSTVRLISASGRSCTCSGRLFVKIPTSCVCGPRSLGCRLIEAHVLWASQRRPYTRWWINAFKSSYCHWKAALLMPQGNVENLYGTHLKMTKRMASSIDFTKTRSWKITPECFSLRREGNVASGRLKLQSIPSCGLRKKKTLPVGQDAFVLQTSMIGKWHLLQKVHVLLKLCVYHLFLRPLGTLICLL